MVSAEYCICDAVGCSEHCVVFFSATIRPENPVMKKTLGDFGEYIAQCMPKYVQHVQVTNGNELEVLIHPDGVLPVLSFLKNHTNAQFTNVADICGLDVPTRQYRFEVETFSILCMHFHVLACISMHVFFVTKNEAISLATFRSDC